MSASGLAPATPTDRILVRGAKQIVTMQGPSRIRVGHELRDVGLIRDGAILIENGLITQVGSTRRIENLKEAANARFLDARQLLVLPAFVDFVSELLPMLSNAPEDRHFGAPHPTGEAESDPRESPYTVQALNTVVRRLEREIKRLQLSGAVFTQFGLRFPEQAVLQSRLLRNLLQLNLPRHRFHATLHFDRLPPHDDGLSVPLPQRLSRAARGFWRQLEGSVSVSVRADSFKGLAPGDQLRALRSLHSGLPCFLSAPESTDVESLLALCVGGGTTITGDLPFDEQSMGAFARYQVPWLAPVSALMFAQPALLSALRQGIRAGMPLGICSGFDVNSRGVSSPFPAAALLRHNETIQVEEFLHLSITNLAYALGLGHRLGSIAVGKEASLVLLECDDYREIGVHLGFPPIRGTLRRGNLLDNRLVLRG